jgi:hypothetical protein
MPILTVKSSSPGYPFEDLPLGNDIARDGSNTATRMAMPDTAHAALPLGHC